MKSFSHKTPGDVAEQDSSVQPGELDRLRMLAQIVDLLEFGTSNRFNRALEAATEFLRLEEGVISRVTGDEYRIAYCHSASGTYHAGMIYEVAATCCSNILREQGLIAFERYEDAPEPRYPSVQSYIGVPIHVDGLLFGTLCLCSSKPRETPWTEADKEFVRLFSLWLGQSLMRVQTERSLLEKEELLGLFVKHSPAAVAMLDRELRYLAVSDFWLRDYNIPDRNIIGRHHYETFPDVPERWKELHQQCLRGMVLRCEEDSFVRADGTTEWLQWELHPWHKQDGEIGGIIMFTQVITGRKQSAAALASSERRFRTLIQLAPVGIYLTDREGRCISVNEKWSEIAGLAESEARGEGWLTAIHPDDAEQVYKKWQLAAKTGGDFEMEFRWQHHDGASVWCYSTATGIYDEEGAVDGYLGTVTDITAMKEYEKILEAMAHSDELTRLLNRRSFEAALHKEIARSRRYGTPLSLLLLDLDHFKRINDTFGHTTGDEILRRTGLVLQESVRLADTAARWGGEEFAVLLPETPLHEAVRFAERLRQRIENIEYEREGVRVPCSVSIGCAGYQREMLDEAALFAAADRALYAAKEQGRNRVVQG